MPLISPLMPVPLMPVPLQVKRSKSFLRITLFNVVVESRRQRLKCSLFNFLNNSKHDYSRRTDSFKDWQRLKVGAVS